MTDIVQRLSDLSDGYEEVEEFELAIAEINMLRKELGECRVAFESGNNAVAENLRLLKEIDRMKNDVHSCHPGCTKAGCVNDRLRELLKTQSAANHIEVQEQVLAERERCANKLNLTRAEAHLQCGEMSNGEWRTVAAVLRWKQDSIWRSI